MQQATPADPAATRDIREFIDACPVSLYQLRIVALCFLVVALDGFDTSSIGFIAPGIRDQWALAPTALAPVFGASLLGLMLGAFLFGPLSDRFGRRTILITTVAWFGLACLASAFAPSFEVLVALRFVTGLGLGGAWPNAVTLTAEYCPARRRSTLLTLMFCGFALGGALGGGVAALLMQRYGWRGVLVTGGLMPLALVIPLLLWLPESPRYLVQKGAPRAKIARVIARLAPGVSLDDGKAFTVRQAPAHAGVSVVDLFRQGNLRGTLLLWSTFFMGLLMIFLLQSWLPVVLRARGLPLEQAALIAALLQTGGFAGALGMGYLMDRLNPSRVVAAAYCLGAVAIFTFGHAQSPLVQGLAVFLAGCGVSGSQVCISVMATGFYPTHCRATGVSWASGVGRIGAIFGSMVGGWMLAWGWSSPTMFTVIALPALFAAASMFAIGRPKWTA
ncbi:4-hydroxybenzoate transporter [Burkholderia sp. SRS-W-2-2016]|uniref:MFS transporter n=1 Tax=Burkholderia sp. SRS-W-2-2016 TaxID=1926878 RepID=UPI00094AB216|nr:aromatic acid/H+ symport family MFS transporter [Burkholderia sp. SRS-W-2-2016]OLL30795.1 4-hydroxybenzoate transporter [Burkholderia sp. SRS-W-2-2016]